LKIILFILGVIILWWLAAKIFGPWIDRQSALEFARGDAKVAALDAYGAAIQAGFENAKLIHGKV
jgi:hypothetical protein